MNKFALLILLVAVIRSSAIAAEVSWTLLLPEFTEPTYGDSTSGNGINISYSDNITVQGSQANNNRFRGMRVPESTRIAFLDNATANNQDVGILVNSEKDEVHDFRVLGNISTGNRIGIETTENSSGGEVSNNDDSVNKVQQQLSNIGDWRWRVANGCGNGGPESDLLNWVRILPSSVLPLGKSLKAKI